MGAVRITLRHKPVIRDRLFTGVLIGAFIHGAYLVYPFRFLIFKVSVFWNFMCMPASSLFLLLYNWFV